MAGISYKAIVFLCVAFFASISAGEGDAANDAGETKVAYAKNSVCRYCEYCIFCKLCDQDCPCTTSPSKPNCDMCKYCKYCPVCRLCDTICSPGGIVDSMSSSIISALPSFNKQEVDDDIKRMDKWIKIKRDEL